MVPIYGRGGDNSDPRKRTGTAEATEWKDTDEGVPMRPAGQRAVPVQVCTKLQISFHSGGEQYGGGGGGVLNRKRVETLGYRDSTLYDAMIPSDVHSLGVWGDALCLLSMIETLTSSGPHMRKLVGGKFTVWLWPRMFHADATLRAAVDGSREREMDPAPASARHLGAGSGSFDSLA